jgi:hypothetical protein
MLKHADPQEVLERAAKRLDSQRKAVTVAMLARESGIEPERVAYYVENVPGFQKRLNIVRPGHIDISSLDKGPYPALVWLEKRINIRKKREEKEKRRPP